MSMGKNPAYIYVDSLSKDEKDIVRELLQTNIPEKAKTIVYYFDDDAVLCFTVGVLERFSYDRKKSLDEFIEVVLENKMNYLVGINAE